LIIYRRRRLRHPHTICTYSTIVSKNNEIQFVVDDRGICLFEGISIMLIVWVGNGRSFFVRTGKKSTGKEEKTMKHVRIKTRHIEGSE
jgi:hypothetical protein